MFENNLIMTILGLLSYGIDTYNIRPQDIYSKEDEKIIINQFQNKKENLKIYSPQIRLNYQSNSFKPVLKVKYSQTYFDQDYIQDSDEELYKNNVGYFKNNMVNIKHIKNEMLNVKNQIESTCGYSVRLPNDDIAALFPDCLNTSKQIFPLCCNGRKENSLTPTKGITESLSKKSSLCKTEKISTKTEKTTASNTERSQQNNTPFKHNCKDNETVVNLIIQLNCNHHNTKLSPSPYTQVRNQLLSGNLTDHLKLQSVSFTRRPETLRNEKTLITTNIAQTESFIKKPICATLGIYKKKTKAPDQEEEIVKETESLTCLKTQTASITKHPHPHPFQPHDLTFTFVRPTIKLRPSTPRMPLFLCQLTSKHFDLKSDSLKSKCESTLLPGRGSLRKLKPTNLGTVPINTKKVSMIFECIFLPTTPSKKVGRTSKSDFSKGIFGGSTVKTHRLTSTEYIQVGRMSKLHKSSEGISSPIVITKKGRPRPKDKSVTGRNGDLFGESTLDILTIRGPNTVVSSNILNEPTEKTSETITAKEKVNYEYDFEEDERILSFTNDTADFIESTHLETSSGNSIFDIENSSEVNSSGDKELKIQENLLTYTDESTRIAPATTHQIIEMGFSKPKNNNFMTTENTVEVSNDAEEIKHSIRNDEKESIKNAILMKRQHFLEIVTRKNN